MLKKRGKRDINEGLINAKVHAASRMNYKVPDVTEYL